MRRWAKSGSGPKRSEHIQRLSQIYEILEFGIKLYTVEGLREYFKAALPVFGHRTAFNMLSSGKFDAVLRALAADYESAVSYEFVVRN